MLLFYRLLYFLILFLSFQFPSLVRIALLSSPPFYSYFFFNELDVHDWNGHDGADIPELVVVFAYINRLLNDFNTCTMLYVTRVSPDIRKSEPNAIGGYMDCQRVNSALTHSLWI